MPQIEYEGVRHQLAAGESVLDALLRHGHRIPHSCKAGSCGSCLMRSASGAVPERAQQGLKEAWKAQGYFLSCVCHPSEDLTVRGADARIAARITAREMLSGDVARVRVRCHQPLEFRAGQYITLQRADGLSRSYSIASLPEEGELDLHVRRVAQGRMSGWLHEEAQPGDEVGVLGPLGECFYVAGREDQPLLLAGTGTGLAPLYGIVKDALRSGHRGPIHLFHGALHLGGLYLSEELRALARQHPQFTYTAAILAGEPAEGLVVGALDRAIEDRHPQLAGWRGFLCGDPGLVRNLKTKVFLAGMASRDIHADAFVPSASA